jgi:hypothetical protein
MYDQKERLDHPRFAARPHPVLGDAREVARAVEVALDTPPARFASSGMSAMEWAGVPISAW